MHERQGKIIAPSFWSKEVESWVYPKMIEFSGGYIFWLTITLTYIGTRLLSQLHFYNMTCLGTQQL